MSNKYRMTEYCEGARQAGLLWPQGLLAGLAPAWNYQSFAY